jgi:hypothetical protein
MAGTHSVTMIRLVIRHTECTMILGAIALLEMVCITHITALMAIVAMHIHLMGIIITVITTTIIIATMYGIRAHVYPTTVAVT